MSLSVVVSIDLHSDLSIYDITGYRKQLVFYHQKNGHARKELGRQW